MAMTDGAPKPSAPPRPTISLPPRSSMEALFTGAAGGLSPGPLTLVSNYFDNFADSGTFSFSQLLAGAMASPAATAAGSFQFPGLFPVESSSEVSSDDGGETKLGFKQNRPVNLVVPLSPMFGLPPGFSPSGLLMSPGLFSPLQSPFGMTHQQALAQVTALAALSQSYMNIQPENQPAAIAASSETLTFHQPLASNTASENQVQSVTSEPESLAMESPEVSLSEIKSLPSSVGMDKPAHDGYNWRKYGQKQVKSSEYPRSYYKCTHLNCPVRKKVERNRDGKISEIIYKGQHNHEVPQSNKKAKSSSGIHIDPQPRAELALIEAEISKSNTTSLLKLEADQTSAQLPTSELSGSSTGVEASEAKRRIEEDGNGEPDPKRRNTEDESLNSSSSHKSVAEPRIIVQTRSEVDVLDDGFKWRKYGQKVVKGNTNPRSYYKCTTPGCNVRKHVERAPNDPGAVVTTYEGKHNHDTPAVRRNSYKLPITTNKNA